MGKIVGRERGSKEKKRNFQVSSAHLLRFTHRRSCYHEERPLFITKSGEFPQTGFLSPRHWEHKKEVRTPQVSDCEGGVRIPAAWLRRRAQSLPSGVTSGELLSLSGPIDPRRETGDELARPIFCLVLMTK